MIEKNKRIMGRNRLRYFLLDEDLLKPEIVLGLYPYSRTPHMPLDLRFVIEKTSIRVMVKKIFSFLSQ